MGGKGGKEDFGPYACGGKFGGKGDLGKAMFKGKVVTPNMQREFEAEMGKFGFGPSGQATEDDAIREMKKQLAKPPHNKIYIQDWNVTYSHLARSQKDYLMSRPDLFEMSFEGNRYTVTWVGGDYE